jgi:hypothetical protein
MLNTDFVAGVLEGIEGTLEELIGRVDPSDLRGRLTGLLDETAAVRRSFEETVSARADGDPAGFEGALSTPKPRSETATRLGSPDALQQDSF